MIGAIALTIAIAGNTIAVFTVVDWLDAVIRRAR